MGPRPGAGPDRRDDPGVSGRVQGMGRGVARCRRVSSGELGRGGGMLGKNTSCFHLAYAQTSFITIGKRQIFCVEHRDKACETTSFAPKSVGSMIATEEMKKTKLSG